ncbi:helix-turn-helix transcriptional regulator [Nocardia sp. NPDC057030]|uniref:PadR family transcriptional regulator n=1 Tax=unclassified Nocardia TaxID=2637762 RepID=UPI00363A0A18
MREIRMTLWTVVVLREFVVNAPEPQYGFDLMKRCNLASGTLYPILARLEKAGWIVGRLEVIDAVKEARRPRKHYVLTPEAHPIAVRALREFTTRAQPPLSAAQIQVRESRRRRDRAAAKRAAVEEAKRERAEAERARRQRARAEEANRERIRAEWSKLEVARGERARAELGKRAQEEAIRRAAADRKRQLQAETDQRRLEEAKRQAIAEYRRQARRKR